MAAPEGDQDSGVGRGRYLIGLTMLVGAGGATSVVIGIAATSESLNILWMVVAIGLGYGGLKRIGWLPSSTAHVAQPSRKPDPMRPGESKASEGFNCTECGRNFESLIDYEDHFEAEPPLILGELWDLTFHRSIGAVLSDYEPWFPRFVPDYVAYDSVGRRLELISDEAEKDLNVRATEHEPTHAEELHGLLDEWLRRTGDGSPSTSLAEAVARCVERDGYTP